MTAYKEHVRFVWRQLTWWSSFKGIKKSYHS